MEQKIVELSSQREFYRANNSRLQSVLERNSAGAFLNGSNATGGHFQLLADVTPGNNPPVAGLPPGPAHSSGQEPQEKGQQVAKLLSSSMSQFDASGMSPAGMAPRQASDTPPPMSDAHMVWTSASGSTPDRWTLSGWKQGAFEPQSGLTPLADVPVPRTTA